jgi:hypothetical protein
MRSVYSNTVTIHRQQPHVKEHIVIPYTTSSACCPQFSESTSALLGANFSQRVASFEYPSEH